MDWWSLGSMIFGMFSGFVTADLRNRRRYYDRNHDEYEKKQDLLPKCLCDHWFNEHKAVGKECLNSSTIQTRTHSLSYSNQVESSTTQRCACVGYIGPDPVVSGLWQGEGLKGETQ